MRFRLETRARRRLAGLLGLLLAATAGISVAQTPTGVAPRHARQQGRTVGRVSLPVALAYASVAGTLLVVEGEPDGSPRKIHALTPDGRTVGSIAWTPANVTGPVHMAFDAHRGRLLLFDPAAGEVIEIAVDPTGLPDPSAAARILARGLDVRDARGLAIDPRRGRLFLLDGDRPGILQVATEQSAYDRWRRPARIPLAGTGIVAARGLAIDPTTGNFHVLDRATHLLYEVNDAGRVVSVRDLTWAELVDPGAMVFARSGDATDDPGEVSLYIADAGGAASRTDRVESGRVVELQAESPQTPVTRSLVPAELVNTIDTSQFAAPSPDPAGLAYRESTGNLLISDSEVNEVAIFAGVNIWETSRDGVVSDAGSTIPFSLEPTGVAVDPSGARWFFSDDDTQMIFEVDLGGDNLFGTADDVVTSFDTSAFGCNDPEGLTYDTSRGICSSWTGSTARCTRSIRWPAASTAFRRRATIRSSSSTSKSSA